MSKDQNFVDNIDLKEMLACERARVIAMRAELAEACANIAHKNDAIDSYAEFYKRAAALAGLPEDCNPSAEADEIILKKIAEREWTSVLDRLPHDQEQVLCKEVRGAHTVYEVARYMVKVGLWTTGIIHPTHWQPLPPLSVQS